MTNKICHNIVNRCERLGFKNPVLNIHCCALNTTVIRNLLFIAILFCGCSSPKMLEYTDYKNFKIDKLGFSNSDVSLELQYFNPNNFGLQFRKSDLDIFVNNNLLGHSSSDTMIYIPRRDTFLLPIKFTVNMQNLFRNALSTLAGNEVLIKVNGKIKLGKANVFMNMPVIYEGKHKFSLL